MYKVLLVDDEMSVCIGLKKLVNWGDFGFTIAGIAYDGKEALNLHLKEHFDLIVTDLKMPVMDGLELIREVHDSPYPCEMVIVSAYGEFKYAQKAMQYGVNYYLIKPVDEAIVEGFLSQVKEKLDAHEKPMATIPNPELIQRQYSLSNNGAIIEIRRYINDHFSEPLTLSFLAQKYSFSPAYLGRLFRKEMGVQFNDYLRNLRIREACDMMEDTEMSINDIAEKCGFSDPYYFSRQFKQVMQMSPQQYKQLRNTEQK